MVFLFDLQFPERNENNISTYLLDALYGKQALACIRWLECWARSALKFYLSQPNSTSTQVGIDKVGPPPTHPLKLLRHFQATQEADFRYATLF